MKFNRGQKVRILKKSVGVSYENSRVCQSCRENGCVTYIGTGSCSANDIIFKKWFPTIIEIEE